VLLAGTHVQAGDLHTSIGFNSIHMAGTVTLEIKGASSEMCLKALSAAHLQLGSSWTLAVHRFQQQ
jgi:hypothetical protein